MRESRKALADFLCAFRHLKGNLDDDAFATIRDALLSYMQSEYLYGPAESKAVWIRNKFSQVLSLFFLATYESKWPTFFESIFSMLKPPPESGIPPFNRHVSAFFFRLLIEISSEVADQTLKNSRHYDPERIARDGRVRDRIRDKDAVNINQAVLTIVAEGKQKMDEMRGSDGHQDRNKIQEVEEVVDLGVRTFASYVRESSDLLPLESLR